MTLARPTSVFGFSHSQLMYFVRVAEEGQITRAASALYIAQPALSQAIGRLERQLGFALLERHPRGVSLTPAGAAFLPKAKAVVAAGEEAALAARALARGHLETLEIGFLSSPPQLTAPNVLERFAAANHNVRVSFRELPFPTAPAAEWLADVDLAVCHSPISGPGIQSLPLWSEPRAVLMRDTHPLAAREELSVDDVLDARFYGFHPSVDPGWASYWTLDDHRGGPPQRTGDTPSNALELVAALTTGRGISLCPHSVARTIAGIVPELAVRPLADAVPTSCALVWRTPPKSVLTLALVEAAGEELDSLAGAEWGAGEGTADVAAAAEGPATRCPGRIATSNRKKGVKRVGADPEPGLRARSRRRGRRRAGGGASAP